MVLDGEDMDSEAASSWDGNGYEIFAKDEDGNISEGIAGGIPDEANAAFIVKAVNCHDELVECLQAFIAQEVEYMTINHLGDPEKQHNVIRGRAILSKAGQS